MVALPGRLPDHAHGLVGVSVVHAHDDAIGGSEHGLAEAVPGHRALWIALRAAPVDEPHEVECVALEGMQVVVTHERAAPASGRSMVIGSSGG